LTAGVDMDMQAGVYLENLADLVAKGMISQEQIDLSLRRILRIKFLLGLFNRPYVDPALSAKLLLCPEHLKAARESAVRSIVLLKNDKELLPLSKKIKTLAVIGPLADSKADPLGCWNFNGRAEETVSVLDGLAAKLPQTKILFERGCDVVDTSTEGFSRAVAAAKKADVVLMVVGESANLSGEAASRANIDLPGVQEELVKAVYGTQKPTVVILMNGRPLTISWLAEHIPAILETWHLGTQHGNAVADVLFGDAVPGGKLPVTWPRVLGQVPIYHSVKNTGRPPVEGDPTVSHYLDIPFTPLYPFGYGLSYTKFEFNNLKVTPAKTGPQGTVTVTVDVKNTGSRTGDEVAQLYIRDIAGSTTRPVKELKGFRRITLQPGELRTVEFKLGPEHLGFYNPHMEYVVEPGDFKVMAGPNSRDVIEADFKVVE
jgi:beta-glucosidase